MAAAATVGEAMVGVMAVTLAAISGEAISVDTEVARGSRVAAFTTIPLAGTAA
jgi:hypothetical protein